MFYIEENDKPNWLQKKINIVMVNESTILLPILKDKKIEKIATKTKKIIEKSSNSKKVVISKEIKKENKYIDYLNSYGIKISDGQWLFEILLPQIVEYIINKKIIKKNGIAILINDLTDIEVENIKILARNYKSINIITNHAEKFKNIEEKLQENEGITITITNNKKRSLMKSEIILNIDFPQELINKYNINDDAVIVNVKEKIKIKNKRFNGLNINDYEIDFRDDLKENKALNGKYYLKDIYESQLYRNQKFEDITKKLKNDKVIIKNLKLNNGNL